MDKRLVIHHVTGRLSGIRRIIGHTIVETDAALPAELAGDMGDGSIGVVDLIAPKKKYVLYRERPAVVPSVTE